jgi:Protein of unknown function (DUF4232)
MRQLDRTYRQASAAAAAARAALMAAACAVLLATACGAPSVHPTAVQPSAVHPAAAVTPRPTGSAAPSPSGGAGASAPAPNSSPSLPAGARLCPTSALRASIGPADGAAGSTYYPLEFTNVSGAACTMFGYPGVSLVTGVSGRQLGGAAVRNPTFRPRAVTLGPGASAHATLQVVVAQNYPPATCDPVTAHRLRVYPPDQFAALFVRFTAVTCAGKIAGGSTLGIYVVRPGSTGP